MKIKTLLVAPYRGLMELASGLAADQHELQLSLVHADLSEILPLLKQYEEDGVEMIISRGGTAKLISQYCELPVIEIPVTGFDIFRMLTLLKEYTVKLEMVGFPNIVEGVVSVSNVMEFELPYTIIHHENEVEAAIERAKARGVAIIVGDSIAVRLAERSGLQGILITSGREAILEAFHQTKQVYGYLSKYKQKNSVCEQILDQLDAGTARLAQDGAVRYANTAFYQMLGLTPLEEGTTLFGRVPYLQRLLPYIESSWGYRDLVVYDGIRKFSCKLGIVQEGTLGGKEYNVVLAPVVQAGEELALHYEASKYESLLSWVIGTTGHMRSLMGNAASLTYPLVVQGNKGTGKSVYAQAILTAKQEQAQEFFEVRVQKGTVKALARLKELLGQSNAGFYVTGLEQLSQLQQRELLGSLQLSKGNLIFGFDEPLKQLHEKEKLDGKLYDWLKKKETVAIPSLKEMEDFDAIVRSLIVKYNEKYGKQIVGIRPQVMEFLLQQPWNGDLLELKNVIREFVKRTEGEFMDTDVLKQPQEPANRGGAGAWGDKPLNLKQPLKKIVNDILHIVLEEENMNQSKAAERLGINRSTLWSKLKEEA